MNILVPSSRQSFGRDPGFLHGKNLGPGQKIAGATAPCAVPLGTIQLNHSGESFREGNGAPMPVAVASKKNNLVQEAINTLRFLAVDAVEKANSGHPGMPMGMASIAHVLWTKFLNHNPKNPKWPNRDRFVLSNGHGSMLLYALLHLTGYDLSLEEIKNFRQWHSKTPGHPEYGETPGVETTTGPLGQGLATAVGMAMAQKYLNSLFTPKGKPLLDHHVYVFAGDGCLMEGVASEAASLAGHLGLGKMIVIYDDNHISIEGHTELAFTEDVLARFKAYKWNTLRVKDGNDLQSIAKALQLAKKSKQPTLIAVRTHIGYGSPNKVDSHDAHGAALGKEEVAATKQNLNWPAEPDFYIPEMVETFYRQAIPKGEAAEQAWNKRFEEWSAHHPELRALWDRMASRQLPENWRRHLPDFSTIDKVATRVASGQTINALAPILPELLGGSADLAPSNNTFIKGAPSFTKKQAGRNIHFGVREHAMAAALNGMALSDMLIPYGGTFFNFTDYMKGAMRLSALMKVQTIYVLTHDSIGLGEDGPTHQPIEQLAAFRAMPNTIVIRPADANETAAAWAFALEHRRGPVLLVLSRQNLPVLRESQYPEAGRVDRGAYILSEAKSGQPQIILIATGSEVSLALNAQIKLESEGYSTRVVSMPSWEIFQSQPSFYRDQVLPHSVRARVAIEALSTFGWERWVGSGGAVIGMHSFGVSAPGAQAMEKLGFTADNIAQKAKQLLQP
ncbi:MAG: Transketolase [Elusimicrobia bacterium]|nr:Transketolase [Elusimicrobiota bacterium]